MGAIINKKKGELKVPTLFDALSDCSFDLQNKRDLSGDFSKKLISYRDKIISEYLKFGTDLSELISNVAKKESLNDDQIQRIVEEVNNQVYLIKYDKLKGQNEREVDFDIASVAKVKNKIKGVENTSNNTGVADTKVSEKSAFESDKCYFEKVASTETSDLFSRNIEYSYGNLGVASRKSKEEFYIQKIAETIKNSQDELNKIAREVNHSVGEISETFIHLERLGADTDAIMSTLMKKASITENGLNVIKECITEKIANYVERNYVPENFEVKFDNLVLDKTASEKFTLGKYSFNKEASEIKIPSICLSTNKKIASVSDIEKIALNLKDNINLLDEKNNKYILLREKVASSGIEEYLDEDFFFQKTAGIIDSINKLTKMVKSSKVYGNLSGANMSSAKKTMDKAKSKMDDLVNSTPIKKYTENIKSTKNSIKNIDKIIADQPEAINLNSAKRTLERAKIDNRGTLRKAENQSFIRNIFDKDVRRAKKTLRNAESNLNSAQNKYNNYKNSTLDDLRKSQALNELDLDTVKAENNFNGIKNNLDDAKKAYNKAVRNTYATRGAVIGVPTLIGANIAKRKSNKNNIDNSYNNYSNFNDNYNSNYNNLNNISY